MKTQKQLLHSGTSLVEILVIIAIAVLLTSGVVINMGGNRGPKNVQSAAEIIRDKIVEARSYALNPGENSFNLQYIEMRIHFESTPPQITFHEFTGNYSDIKGLDTKLPSGIKISSTSFNSSNGADKYIEIRFDASNLGQLGQVIISETEPIILITDANNADNKRIIKVNRYSGVVELQ